MAKAFAYLVVGLRFPLILGWAAAVVAAVLFLPPLPSSGGLADLIPAGSAAAHADADATRLFGYPLEAGVAIVQRDPRDLPPSVVETTAHAAVGYDRNPGIPGLLAVVPVPNGAGVPAHAVTASPVGAAGLLAGAKQHTSTIVTYLDFRSDATLDQQVSDARAYAGRYLTHVAATRIVAWGAQRTGIAVPQDADPVLIVLLLGVTTDYCVFFLAGMRSRLGEGAGRLQAARDSTARSAPIVLAAGLIVAAGTGALVVARGGLLRAFGPGLAVTVLVSMVVSLTLMPALLGVFGGLMFRGTAGERPTAAGFRLARLAASKPVALLVAAGCVAGLVLAASGARGLGLGSPLIGEMPPSSDVARAGAAAAAGFAPGILAPAEVLVIGPGAGAQTAAGNLVGRIWEEARALPAQDAVAVAAPRASRAITTAGVALAASFGLLALIPLEQFRQLAIIMAVGVMLDSVVVRSFLVPALVALTGRFGMWPGHQRVRVAVRRPPELSDASR